MRCVAVTIAIGHKVQEHKQVLQAQHGLLTGDLLAGVGGGVADAADEVQAEQQLFIHDAAELLGAQEADQLIIPGHDQRAVHGVHPLDGDLHGPAAVQRAGGGVDGEDALGGDGDRDEGGEAGVGLEGEEVGHGGSPLIQYSVKLHEFMV